MSKAVKIIVAMVASITVFVALVRREVLHDSPLEKDKRHADEIEKLHSDWRSEKKRDFTRDGTTHVETSINLLNQVGNLVDRIASENQADSGPIREVATVLTELKQRLQRVRALDARVESESPMNVSTVKTKDDLQARRDLLREMLQTNQELRVFRDSLESKFRHALQNAGVSGESLENSMSVLTSKFQRGGKNRVRLEKANDVWAASAIAMMDLLDAEWGTWRFADNKIAFDQDDAARRYNDMADANVKASGELVAAHRELAELLLAK